MPTGGSPASVPPPVPPLVMLDVVDSTNAEAQRRAASGERGPLWICARAQSQGRGRSGRSWGSPQGSLAATLLFCPTAPLSILPELALVAGVATADAIGSLLPRPATTLRIKWPNDILLDVAKVSGILVESALFGRDQVAFVGIGINIADKPDIPDRAITSLAEHGVSTTPDAFAPRLAGAMANRLSQWHHGAGFAAIRTAWLERAGPPGQEMSVNTGKGIATGTFAGLDTDGALLLQDAMGRRQRFTFGDVSHGAPAKA
ncbi:MAG: biotin--[acetyl-CoA-carboxylase] ligase [Hyphomicrobiaceae bacterium]